MSRKYSASYESYRKRYLKSLSIVPATTKYNNYLEWNDRNGASGSFCAEEGKQITTQVNAGTGYQITFYSPNNFGYRSLTVLNYFVDTSIIYSVDGVPYYGLYVQRCSDPGLILGPGISIDKTIIYDFNINCSEGNYIYYITDTVNSEVHSIAVPDPTENRDIKGYEWIYSQYLIKAFGGSICNHTNFSCTCPDFTQQERPGWRDENGAATRDWSWSQAGPFNPCKHIMACKRLLKIPQSYPGTA